MLWFTGLSGSGKSTLTAMVAAELRRRGVHVEALDGDEIRKHLSKGLGFSKEDRDTSVRRLGFVANLIARSGGCAITAAISPYRALREEVRRGAERFCEVYCECPVAVLVERDPKGLYEKALRGEIKNFTGVDDPYEAPSAPELHLHTDREAPEASAARIIARLEELGWLAPSDSEAKRGLVPPHGGELIERLLSERAAGVERERALGLPRVRLDADAKAWLWGFATGALSPLAGFVGEKDYLRISAEQRLERGLFWPVPPLLRPTHAELSALPDGCTEVALVDQDARPLATLQVSERWSCRRPDGTRQQYLAGDVSVFDLRDFAEQALTARAVRASLEQRGQVEIVALGSARVPSLATEYVARSALELADGLLLLPLASAAATIDLRGRVRASRVLADQFFAPGRVSVCPLALPQCSGLDLATALVAIMAQNFGASRLLLGPELGAHRLPVAAVELAIEPVLHAWVGKSKKLGQLASERTAPDPLSGPALPENIDVMPASGEYRPEVLAALGR